MIETLRLRFLSIALCCSFFFIPLSKLSPAPISKINWSYVKQKVLPNSIKNRFRPTFFLTTVRKNVTPRIVVSTHRGTTYKGVEFTVCTGCFQVRPHSQVWSNLLILHFDCVYTLQQIWLFSRVKTLKKSIKKPWKKLF